MSINTRTFWAETAERSVKTFAQTALSLLGVASAAGVIVPAGVLALDWRGVLISAAFAALLSVLTSIASGASPFGAQGSPSVVETSGRHAA